MLRFQDIMADLKFDGDLVGISEGQLEYVRSVLKGLGYENEKVMVSPVGNVGDGYVANVKRFNVEKNGATFKMVAKIAPGNELLRAQMNPQMQFKNEHIMYTEVLPKFTELEKEAGVPENKRLRYAACYGSHIEEPNEIILLEDLQLSNFVMMDRHGSLTDDTVKIYLKSFASLHSCSYALKNQEPETYESYKNKLQNIFLKMPDIELMKLFFSKLEKDVIALLTSDKHKKLVQRLLPQLQHGIVKNLKIDRDSKYSIIQQGDSWTNNVLFRLEGEKPVECCMIDYQLSNSNTPVADLQSMIFNCTDYETRAKHYHDWIDFYHSELDRCLAYFGLKANFVYPRDQLDADLRRYGKISFALSLMMANIMMGETQEAVKMKEAIDKGSSLQDALNISDVSHMEKSTTGRIKAKIEGLINSFTEFGYL